MTRPLLVIEDDDDLREAIAMTLATSGSEVAAFGDAREALRELQSGLRPFLILLDLMMPNMSGWEFREAQEADPAIAPIPVVVITAAHTLGNGRDSLTGIEVLRKPFSLEALLEVVRRYRPRT
jgi:two-component system, chemotaxis family, chemotaxis protein CheY